MAFIFEGLLGSSLTLAGLYFLLSLYTFRRLQWLQSHSSPGLNTRKLYVMTLLLTVVLRFMSFLSMVLLDLQRVHYQIDSAGSFSDDDNTKNTNNSQEHEFFEKATLVLFDFPDFCCISAYVLLIVVWSETYLKSRRHWLSSLRFRRVWMFTYFIFNILLYSAQVALYSLLFLPNINPDVLMNLIYLTLSGFSLMLPVIWVMSYFYLAFMFSGFPFSTMTAKMRLKNLNSLGALWTLSRLFWGLIALTTVLQGWLTEAKKSELFYSVILVCIFFISEMLPILYSLQSHMIQSLSEEQTLTLPPQGNDKSPTRNSLLNNILYGSSVRTGTKPSPSEGVVETDHYMDADHLTHLLPPNSNYNTPMKPGEKGQYNQPTPSTSATETTNTARKRFPFLYSVQSNNANQAAPSANSSPYHLYHATYGAGSPAVTPVNISINNATNHSHHNTYVVNPMFQNFNRDHESGGMDSTATLTPEEEEAKFHDAQTLISPSSSVDERSSYVTAQGGNEPIKSPPAWWNVFGLV